MNLDTVQYSEKSSFILYLLLGYLIVKVQVKKYAKGLYLELCVLSLYFCSV